MNASLIGRDAELEWLGTFLSEVGQHGSAVLVHGEAGIGKTALLAVVAENARELGLSVLSVVGVQTETQLAYAGLHQLLRPALDQVDRLPRRQREVLLTAFGMADAGPPDVFLIGLATLDVLADLAAVAPLLVVVDDAQWLDEPSIDVLAFLSRRLHSEPIVMMCALRDGYSSPLLDVDLCDCRIGELDETDSALLVDLTAPQLRRDDHIRSRIMAAAAGNPLALVELPSTFTLDMATDRASPSPLPLSARLERSFAGRLATLPWATRCLVILAAVNDGTDLVEILRSAAAMNPGERAPSSSVDPTDLSPVLALGLVRVDEEGQLHFRHPLVRSAVVQAAALHERLAAHRALASILIDDPDRRAGHLSAATLHPDERVADEIQRAAERAEALGAGSATTTAWERAGRLTPDPERRGQRLLRAAELALERGDLRRAAGLGAETNLLVEAVGDQARVALVLDSTAAAVPGDPARVHSLVDAAARVNAVGDVDLALRLLQQAASHVWAGHLPAEARERVIAVTGQVSVPDEDPRRLSVFGFADPRSNGQLISDSVARLRPDHLDRDSTQLVATVFAIGADPSLAALQAAVVDDLRRRGKLGQLPAVLAQQCWTAINLLNWQVAVPAAAEAEALALETGQPLWVAAAQTGQAMIAGLRGDDALAERLAARAEAVALPLGAGAVLCGVQLTRGVTAIGAGRYQEAFTQLLRLTDPFDPSFHSVQSGWALGDLADAALHSGNRDVARTLVAAAEPPPGTTASPWSQTALLYARPLLAEDDEAEGLYRQSLTTDLSHWPGYRARLLLEYGSWLRRQRRGSAARAPLRAAKEACDALGLIPWAERAREELRATGEASEPRTSDVWSLLSPQELQIAHLAATGMSNRDIGQRLFLSHRTVGSHLYRIFPKLGVTSRSHLRRALPPPADPSDGLAVG